MNAPVPEGIDAAGVGRWLDAHVAGLQSPFTYTLIAGGHSNLTYACTDAAGRRCVLRRPPLGHVLESAHDMSREYRIISALAESAVPVATTYGLCEDTGVNAAPFYVMDFVDGAVLHDSAAATALPASEREALGYHVIEVLAALHAIEPATVGLGELGRRDGYIARQLKRWTRQWEATTTHPVPAMERCSQLLAERMPAQHGSSIVHGDFRLGNFIVGDGRVRAVLDWELCTLGDAMADLGYLMNSWVGPGEGVAGVDERMPTTVGGFPERAALLARYAGLSGRDVGAIDYYRAFSYWRIAAIRQGVYKRYIEGAMGSQDGTDVEGIRRSVEACAEAALVLLGG